MRDHEEKGDIEIKCIDTERHLTDIFIKTLDATRFPSLRGVGGLGGCHPYGVD
jgi:hypothetical protein